MGKVFALLGASATGKSSIETIIQNKGLLERLLSTTSRPMRSNETQHQAYHFITKEEFLNKLHNGDFLEHTQYDVATGDTWYYGIDKNTVDLNKNYIVVVNPNGYRQMKAILGEENVIGILIKTNSFKRLIRSLKRDKNVIYKEVFRRFIADFKDFYGVKNEVKYVIKNNKLDESVKRVENIIVFEMR